MKYIYSITFSLAIAIVAPLGFTASVMGTEPALIPNIGFPSLADLSPAEAVEYMKHPSNYKELTGLSKYIHYTYLDNEYRDHIIAFLFLCAFSSTIFGLWLGSRHART